MAFLISDLKELEIGNLDGCHFWFRAKTILWKIHT